ncbi:MAG: Asp-tRNA(Asn)/Glu-tRNA(Gln) amidotransferase GatCAB subunit C [Crocinitomicaceae bacterium]|nr:Asp-tRNA(Asn)/Glu-tRNA(Gln) amidotransferase GatCAB subunit C [Crocinitomicaceae bacterium]
MKINHNVISKLARLSKLKFNEDEMKLISNDLSKMLEFINQLQDLDTEGIDPLIHVNEEINNWREDQVQGMISQEEALSNSPVKDGTYFKLPKVLE